MTSPHHEGATEERWTYNPYEIAFGGFCDQGKTTTIERLLAGLSKRFEIGYVKHDAHRFVMDKEGKDTWRAWEAGAAEIYIHDPTHVAAQRRGALDAVLKRLLFLEMDMVFIEGHKKSDIPKLLFLDDDAEVLRSLEPAELASVVAVVGRQGRSYPLRTEVPRLDRERLEAIEDFVLSHLEARARSTRLHGLVLAGGESRRMGRDKAALDYHGRPQTEHVLELLGRFCEEVYVSSRAEQSESEGRRGLPQIHDRFVGFGPAGGILSAMHHDPEAAWLVVACDLPFLDEDSLGDLVSHRDPFRAATCYKAGDGAPEPMCAIYEPKLRFRFHQLFAAGVSCPRQALAGSRIRLLDAVDPTVLDNVNEPEQYRRAVAGESHGRG